ncbi:acyltransferase family protein [Nostoc edaphicum CCNP1411]|uniref:Acyltransferase family protein n=1 Tax=Nostoc edaphicum CCNP1411 TaxID=1472755 RepID=A0A7D7LBW9_9NOSO|nr:acyltransferase family protein [Nostoc edaphicum]QMS87071.1 acyltransferase family protein [Nostoc edaphicum CCNP1411]
MRMERNNSLDTLKALSIAFVLIWHLRPFQFILNGSTHITVFVLAKILRDLELQLSLTAVPIFYIVSLYLFFQKSDGVEYFQKRITKLIKIYLFWVLVQNIFFMIVTREIPNFSWQLITGLEPSLPLVGDSVFYFLFNLICLTSVAFLYQLIKSDSLRKIISFTIGIFCLFYFEASCLLNISIPYHWLINFVIYVPIAFYLAKFPDRILSFKFYYLIAFIMFSSHDIYLRTSGYYPSIYGRIAIICGAMTIFCYVNSQKEIKNNLLIQQLSKYSLGLFSLHKYWQYLFFLLINNYKIGMDIGIIGTPLSTIFIIEGLFVVFFTVLSIYLLKLTRLKQFVI